MPESIPQKQCNRCKQFLPITEYTADRDKKDGLRTICKSCSKMKMPSAALPPVPDGLRCCSKCKQCKPPSDFSADRSNKKDGLHYACKECVRAFRSTRKNHYASYRRAYQEQNKERILNRNRRYREKNSEQVRANARAYGQSLQGKAANHARYYRRVARKKAMLRAYTSRDVLSQYQRQHGKCYYCKAQLGTGKYAYHVDHVIPLSRGGSNGPENIVVACPACNWSKGNKFLHEWHGRGRLL